MKDANSGEKDRRSALNKATLPYVFKGCWIVFENEESVRETAFSLKSFLLRGLRGLALIRLGSSVSSPDSLMRGLLPLRQIFCSFLYQSRRSRRFFSLSVYDISVTNNLNNLTDHKLTRTLSSKQRRQA